MITFGKTIIQIPVYTFEKATCNQAVQTTALARFCGTTRTLPQTGSR